MTSIKELPSWGKLLEHKTVIKNITTLSLFDDNRFNNFSLNLNGFLFDYSKNKISTETIELLLELAKDCELEKKRDEMFAGFKINTTEDRAVMHIALRAANAPIEVKKNLDRMAEFANKIYNKDIKDIVNIGIGGSSLGPEVITKALKTYNKKTLKTHYLSNAEASHLNDILENLNPETTLFIICSKSFTTAETMLNAKLAKEWFVEKSNNKNIEDHFAAVSTNIDAAKTFGIAEENIFPIWDWVGGRYSLWSAIGLSSMIMIGADNFKKLLSGAKAMDEHFKTAPLNENIPVIMALIGIWHINFCNYPAYALIPYHSHLNRLPAYMQQLDMESNGKSVDKNGKKVNYATGAIIFGECGTDSQHSFFQYLHQSPVPIPVDFIAIAKKTSGDNKQQNMLLANCIAQSEALMKGQENTSEPHRNFSGSRPNSTILLDELSPYNLGMLLALYEHKIFIQGAIWNINSFDQWGVELGKIMAKKINSEFNNSKSGDHDSSTLGLMKYIKAKNK